MDPTKPGAKTAPLAAPAPAAPDRLIADAEAAGDWAPVWKAVERLIPATVTSPRRLAALYEVLRGWEREDAG
jgi:hypothetical protein